jgi:hypothetical protein
MHGVGVSFRLFTCFKSEIKVPILMKFSIRSLCKKKLPGEFNHADHSGRAV